MKVITKIIFNNEEEKHKTIKKLCPDYIDRRYKSHCDDQECGDKKYSDCEKCWAGTDIELVVKAQA